VYLLSTRRDLEAIARELKELHLKEAHNHDVVTKPKSTDAHSSTPGASRAVPTTAATAQDTPAAERIRTRDGGKPLDAQLLVDSSAGSRAANLEPGIAPKPRAAATSRERLYARMMGKSAASGERGTGDASDASEPSTSQEQAVATPNSSAGTSTTGFAVPKPDNKTKVEEREASKQSSRERLYAMMGAGAVDAQHSSTRQDVASGTSLRPQTPQAATQASATSTSKSGTDPVAAVPAGEKTEARTKAAKSSSRERLYAMMMINENK
jgi:hypothetical protein